MKKNKLIYIILSATLLLGSCDAFLDLEPLDAYSEAIYFQTPEHFQAAAYGLHANVFSRHLNNNANANNTYPLLFDYGTDLVQGGWDVASGTNTPGVSDVYWNQTYSWLRPVNILLQKAEEYSNPSEIAGSVGQAYFFRAWHHFFLLKRFGGVPIADEAADTDSNLLWGPRASRYEVISFILTDLDRAIQKLAGVTLPSTDNDGQVTLEAAKALKARICLFAGTWDKYVGTKTDGDGTASGAGGQNQLTIPL